jgi:hypothetical protein
MRTTWPGRETRLARAALAVALAIAGGQSVHADLRCERSEAAGSAGGSAYDSPGGVAIAVLRPDQVYAIVSSASHSDGVRRLLLAAATGASQVTRHHLGKCTLAIERLYDGQGAPRRD